MLEQNIQKLARTTVSDLYTVKAYFLTSSFYYRFSLQIYNRCLVLLKIVNDDKQDYPFYILRFFIKSLDTIGLN